MISQVGSVVGRDGMDTVVDNRRAWVSSDQHVSVATRAAG